MGRILAIDFGFKRTGLAVTDPLKIIANPLTTIASDKLFDYLNKYFSEEEVEAIVVGMPINLDMSKTHTTEAVEQLVRKLELDYPDKKVHTVDERFTSKIALDTMVRGGMKKSERRKKENVDKISAVIILQSFLDQQS
jgi:putative Holliday junction resolvase